MKLITTLNEIREHSPCEPSWVKLLKSLNKTKADNEPLELMDILETLGIQDAIWCLRCFDHKDYCLFLADVAESVLPIYEKQHPNDSRVKDCIEAIKKYHAGEITEKELKAAAARGLATAAAYAAAAYAYAAAYAAAAYAATAAADAAYAAVDAAAYAYAGAYDADARKEKWQEIEQLFIKHFKE